jgi:hypothetical protein
MLGVPPWDSHQNTAGAELNPQRHVGLGRVRQVGPRIAIRQAQPPSTPGPCLLLRPVFELQLLDPLERLVIRDQDEVGRQSLCADHHIEVPRRPSFVFEARAEPPVLLRCF